MPNGFIQMISPILILTFAWTLCGLTRYGMYSADFVVNAMSGAGELAKFLPAVIFIIGAAIGFATGTSWGTIGIMAPIVVQVFNYDQQPILCTIGLAAACSGGVMGDHCSPISDTTIMASAGAHCFHLNHVFTQIPYALTVAGVTFVSFILAGLIQNVVICLIIAAALMIATLLVIKGHHGQEASGHLPGDGRGQQVPGQVRLCAYQTKKWETALPSPHFLRLRKKVQRIAPYLCSKVSLYKLVELLCVHLVLVAVAEPLDGQAVVLYDLAVLQESPPAPRRRR